MLLAFKELLKESLEGIEGIVRNRLMYLKNMYWYHIDYTFDLSGQINTNMYVPNVHMHESESDDI